VKVVLRARTPGKKIDTWDCREQKGKGEGPGLSSLVRLLGGGYYKQGNIRLFVGADRLKMETSAEPWKAPYTESGKKRKDEFLHNRDAKNSHLPRKANTIPAGTGTKASAPEEGLTRAVSARVKHGGGESSRLPGKAVTVVKRGLRIREGRSEKREVWTTGATGVGGVRGAKL